MWVARSFFILLIVFAALGRARAEHVYYTFLDGDSFGVGRILLGDEKIKSVNRVAMDFPMEDAFKLQLVGKHVVVVSQVDGESGVTILPQDAQPGAEFIPLEAEVSELAAFGDQALIAANKGLFFTIDPSAPGNIEQWNARKELSPPGRKGEDVIILPDGKSALASFQKDDDNSDAKGSRIVVFDLSPLRLRHDLQLPRDRPELHIAGNPKEQGPNPEKLFVFPESNTLALTLDLYGAVAFMDLDAALKGEIKNYTAIPTSADRSWGTAFPDRGLGFRAQGGDWLLVTNASENGGFAVFDVQNRKFIAHYPAKVGAETPVLVESAGKIFSALSGKIKSRTDSGVEKVLQPLNELVVFDVSRLITGDPEAIEALPILGPAERVVATNDGNLLLLNTSETLLIRPDGTVLDRQPAVGAPIRVAH